MANSYSYSQKDIEDSFNQLNVRLDLLPKSPSPHFMLIGGQPGAGKSETIKKLGRERPNLYIIDVDELRQKHPYYAVIQCEEGIGAANHTHRFASDLKDKIVDYLRDKQVDFALEATLGNKDRTLNLVHNPLWKQNGYQIEVHGVAVAKEVSEIGVLKRYFDGRNQMEIIRGIEVDKRRYVPALARDKSYEGMLHTLTALAESRAVDTIGIYDRDGNELIVAHGKDMDSQSIARTLEGRRKLENTSLRQLETALENHAYNQTQSKHIQSQPAHTPAEQNEQKILAADIKQELTHANNIEKAIPIARRKERIKERDQRIQKRLQENKTKNQTHNRNKTQDKNTHDRGRSR